MIAALRLHHRRPIKRRLSWLIKPTTSPSSPAFERTSKRRRGYPSETHVKRGLRFVGGDKELIEKLGRNDPCPCHSGKSFQEMLPQIRPLSMDRNGTIIGDKKKGRRSPAPPIH
ncbi:SEC-C metal-binding domain-containing protein [Erythrobacter sp. Alg231-14]|uniref:SEC-C metal-binding domain-containing protein n=1 Tax=Erythrobacter sp. Alg231-14 TaxID=1922225 RepID=UPI003FCD2554